MLWGGSRVAKVPRSASAVVRPCGTTTRVQKAHALSTLQNAQNESGVGRMNFVSRAFCVSIAGTRDAGWASAHSQADVDAREWQRHGSFRGTQVLSHG